MAPRALPSDGCVCGALTIGQSPRPDIVPELKALVRTAGVDVDFIEAGALDGLTPGEIAALGPRPGESLLVTRLRDGHEVHVSEERVTPLVQAAVTRLEAAGASPVVLLCTDPFPGLRAAGLLVRPEPALRGLTEAAARGRHLGVVVPSPGQTRDAVTRWGGIAGEVTAVGVSPYGAPAEVARDLTDAARFLARGGAELVVLDCLGFGIEAAKVVRRAARVPVVVARTALAVAIGLVLES